MISILTKYWGNVGKRTLHPLRKNGHELELGLRTPREEIAFTAPPKIQSQSMSQNIHGAERCTYQNVSLMKYLAKMSLAKMSGPSCSFNDLKTMFDSTKIVLMLFFQYCMQNHTIRVHQKNSNEPCTFCAWVDWAVLVSTETRVLLQK